VFAWFFGFFGAARMYESYFTPTNIKTMHLEPYSELNWGKNKMLKLEKEFPSLGEIKHFFLLV
jgi:hypothetical protein